MQTILSKETLELVQGCGKRQPPAPDSEQVDAWIVINTKHLEDEEDFLEFSYA